MGDYFTRIKCPGRDAWLLDRAAGIGGSDAACILGLNPFKTNEELFQEKRRAYEQGPVAAIAEQEDLSDKPWIEYGTKAEGSLRQLFRLDFPEYTVRHRNWEILQNNQLPFLQASVDGELTDEKGRKGILEIKTTTIRRGADFEKWKNQIPQNYYCQILHYMLVTRYEYAIVKAMLRIGWDDSKRAEIRHYFFKREDVMEDLKTLLRAEIEFWQRVEDNNPPPFTVCI